jgi:peroxiredoxin Q/BCP
MVRLSDYEGQDVLLVFFRGTWCPNCRRQFRVLCENYERLRKVGMECIGVICQNPGSVQRYLDSNPLPFPLLTDETRNVARQYGVHYWLSYEGFNLAHPSVFILDRDRRVTFAYRGKNQSDLPISAVLEKFVALLEKE